MLAVLVTTAWMPLTCGCGAVGYSAMRPLSTIDLESRDGSELRPLLEAEAEHFGPPQPPMANHSAHAAFDTAAVDSAIVPVMAVELEADGDVLRLSLEDAVMRALEENRELQVQQIEPLVAGTFAQLEKAVYDPVIFGRLLYDRDQFRETDPLLSGQFVTEGEHRISSGIGRRFPGGTYLEGSVSARREIEQPHPSQHATRLGVTLTQALLQGADVQANLARIEQARLQRLVSQYELRGLAEALIAEVEQTYWDGVLARQRVGIVQRSLDVAQRQLEETHQQIDAGVLAETEALAAEAEVALRRQALIDARTQRVTINLRLLRLTNLLSQVPEPEFLDLLTEASDLEVPLDASDQHVLLAQQLRPEVNEARLRLDQGRLEVVQTSDGLLPRLDLFITLGKSGYADRLARSLSPFMGLGYDLMAGLEFAYPIENREANFQHHGAMLRRQQLAAAVQNLEQLVELDVRTAYVEIQRTSQQIDAAARTRQWQERTLEAEQLKFRAGESNSLLVARAQRDLLDSQLEEVEAVVEYRKALVDFYHREGTLLIRRGIAAAGAKLPYRKAD